MQFNAILPLLPFLIAISSASPMSPAYDPECIPNDQGEANLCGGCASYLLSLGTQVCDVDPNGPSGSHPKMCRQDGCNIYAHSLNGQQTSSYCRDVGAAVQQFLQICPNGSGTIAAGGNGNLIVEVDS